MPTYAAAGAGFLVAVLWFDLMFDVQVRAHKGATLPDDTLSSIAAYYARVTTAASPMNMLVSAVMLGTLAAIALELTNKAIPLPTAAASLGLTASAIGLAGSRTVKNAKRLGRREDNADEQSRLARLIYKDHRYCLAVMAATLALQLGQIG